MHKTDRYNICSVTINFTIFRFGIFIVFFQNLFLKILITDNLYFPTKNILPTKNIQWPRLKASLPTNDYFLYFKYKKCI